MKNPYANYDQGHLSHKLAILGLAFTVVFAIATIIVGATGIRKINSQLDTFCFPESRDFILALFSFGCIHTKEAEIISLSLNVLVTVCTESVGFVHGTTLRWALAAENRVGFHANIRLVSASRARFSANGIFSNTLMTLLLIISFACVPLLVFTPFSNIQDHTHPITPYWPASIFLGVSLLLQASIAIWGMLTTSVGTWSGSALEHTAAWAFAGAQPQEGNAMLNVRDRLAKLPWMSFSQKPEKKQISAWRAHKSVRRVVYFIWLLAVACFALFGITYYATFRPSTEATQWMYLRRIDWLEDNYGEVLQQKGVVQDAEHSYGSLNLTQLKGVFEQEINALDGLQGFQSSLPPFFSESEMVNGTFRWSLTPTYDRLSAEGKTWSEFGWGTSGSTAGDLFGTVFFFAAIQGAFTFGLHCAELIVILARDEQAWRLASSKKGTSNSFPLALIGTLTSWQSCGLLIFKPFLHWFFSQGFAILSGDNTGDWKHIVTFTAHPAQMLNLFLVILVFGIFVTGVANHRPKGPQPAAYGHIPTLLDLVDEWHPKMFWGHKGVYKYMPEGSPVYHAGTSDVPLPPVHMNNLYQ